MTGGGLGRLLVISDRRLSEAAGRTLAESVAVAAAAGAPTVLFREKDLPAMEREALGRDVAAVLAGTATRLLVASDAGLARRLGAGGVHLASADRLPAECAESARGGGPPLPFGRSCHSSADVAAAVREGAGWVTISPIFLTDSKPGYGPALGTQLLGGGGAPVFALGGITPARVADCVAAGAHGVAMMGAVMSAPDPAATIRLVLEALG